jgi:hypothetical protein
MAFRMSAEKMKVGFLADMASCRKPKKEYHWRPIFGV